jgi:hypothetical protein
MHGNVSHRLTSCATRAVAARRAAAPHALVVALLFAAALALLGGCATPPVATQAYTDTLSGQVVGAPIEPGEADRYALEPGVRYDHAIPERDNATPAYPESLLALRLDPVEIRVRLVVDATGSVTSVDPLQPLAPGREAFLAVVQDTLGAWRFAPLIRIEEAPGHSTVRYGDVSVSYAGRATALPYHQDYLFVFTQVDGVPQVRASE